MGYFLVFVIKAKILENLVGIFIWFKENEKNWAEKKTDLHIHLQLNAKRSVLREGGD